MDRITCEVRIGEEDQPPETLSAADLGELLREIEAALLVIARAQSITLPAVAPVSVVGIGAGSIALSWSLSPEVQPAWRQAAELIATGVTGTSESVRLALHKIWEWSNKTGRRLAFIANPAANVPAALVNPAIEIAVQPPVTTVSGRTTRIVKCHRAGGKSRPRVLIEIEGRGQGDALFEDVDEDIARYLGARLYQRVVVEGDATWDIATGEILSFRPVRVLDVILDNPVESFRVLAEAARGRWDDVDAVEYVRALREG